MVPWRGENVITSKRIFLKLKCFPPLNILTFPLFEETLGAFLFLSLFSLFFSFLFYDPPLEDLGVLMIFEEKITSSKISFKWHDIECYGHDYGYNGGGRIFQNGVMHANIGKP
jgi:hypothetical protein